MQFTYFDTAIADDKILQNTVKKLRKYRADVAKVIADHDIGRPEYALAHVAEPDLSVTIDNIKKQYKGIKHLVLVGIGGSSLGVEAVQAALGGGAGVQLHTLDTIAPYQIKHLLQSLSPVKKAQQLAVCVVSKSGGTAETLVNAGVLLEALEQKFSPAIYQQTIFIGNSDTPLQKTAKRLGGRVLAMPKIVGGRYSVATEVGLIPLALLGHDVDSFMAGVFDASGDECEAVTAMNAARLAIYANKKYTHYNFFAFDSRLALLGAWYRQLQAESLGKAMMRDGRPLNRGFVPSISTAVELHSVGQLYLSGFAGVYTDFVTVADTDCDYQIPKKGISKPYGRKTMSTVADAIRDGVIGAYQDQGLPYRLTTLDTDLTYSLGLFMGMRMQEIMYTAELLNVNAFDQPSVELYKQKTREILGR